MFAQNGARDHEPVALVVPERTEATDRTHHK
jgi:hypothetical protein